MADRCIVCKENSSVQIRTGEGVGRYIVANKDFESGDIVFRNRASSYVLSSEYWGQKCLRCFSSGTGELLQCAKCKLATYCSKNCQVGDWKQHKGECSHVKSIFDQKLPSSAINEVLLLVRSFSTKQKQTDECCLLGDIVLCGKQHCEGVYYNPLGRIDSSDLLLASLVGRYCQESNPLILRKLQQFHCNNFGIVDELINCIGSGEFPATALLNHSCVPNAILRYTISPEHGPVVEVVAVTTISIGDEICHSYTDCSSPTIQRQQRLRDIYRFGCQCRLCSLSMTTSPERNILSSSSLRDIIEDPLAVKTVVSNALSESSLHLLPIDNLTTETYDRVPSQLLQEQQDIERRALQAEESGDILAAYHEMKQMEKSLEKYYGPLNQDLYHFRCKMLSTVLLVNDVDESIAVCAKIVSFLVVSMANVANHPLLGVQLFTLADLWASKDQEKAKEYYDWCENVLKITHGMDSRLIAHLRQCRS